MYFDVDEATYLRNNKLWFEGKRPSSRDTPATREMNPLIER